VKKIRISDGFVSVRVYTTGLNNKVWVDLGYDGAAELTPGKTRRLIEALQMALLQIESR
jgi:hypothetical protein